MTFKGGLELDSNEFRYIKFMFKASKSPFFLSDSKR